MAIKTFVKGKATSLSTNFKSTEFDCHGSGCCTQTKVDDKLVQYLQQIRNHFGKPVNISSGYRCVTHNKNIGGATGSKHSKGQAADIYINGVAPAEIAKYAESIGILGIGLYETDKDGHFVHVDTRTSKSFWYGQSEAYRSTFGGTQTTTPSTSKVDTSAIDAKMAQAIVQKASHCQTMTEFQGLDEKKKARYMKKIYEKGVSIRQISRLTGISKGVVERLLKAK